MSRRRNSRPKRKINPLYIVFCEGNTEESYAIYLRNRFRIPIEIKTKVTGQNITDKFITNHLKEIRKGVSSDLDKCYLMYDLDAPEFTDRLRKITKAIVLGSNPCFELWYLLHYCNQAAYITTVNCEQGLKKFNVSYEKGKINPQLKVSLDVNLSTAIKRAKALVDFSNPSTVVYRLTEEIIALAKNK